MGSGGLLAPPEFGVSRKRIEREIDSVLLSTLWDFNSKNTGHFQFLQKLFILDVCKLKKKIENFLSGTHEIIPFIRFEIAWTGQINLKKNLGHDIKYLSIWAFMSYPCFPTEKVSKVTFILFCQINSHEIGRGYLSGKRG